MLRGGLVAVLLFAATATATAAAEAPSRYSLAGGCWALRSTDGHVVADHLRLQATRLSSYLLYGPSGDFLAAGDGGAVGPAPQPSPAADWHVEPAAGDTSSTTRSPASASTAGRSVC